MIKLNSKSIVITTVFAVVFILSSCNVVNEISYRKDKHEEYIKECGYIFECNYDLDSLRIYTYTPTYKYYDYLRPVACNKNNLTVAVIGVEFLNKTDTLTLKRVNLKNEYIFTNKDLLKVLKRNKTIKIKILVEDESNSTEVIYLLKQLKHSYIATPKLFGC